MDTFHNNGSFTVADVSKMFGSKAKQGQRCEYSSLSSFIKNWSIKDIKFGQESWKEIKDWQYIVTERYLQFTHPFKRYIRDKKLENILSEQN